MQIPNSLPRWSIASPHHLHEGQSHPSFARWSSVPSQTHCYPPDPGPPRTAARNYSSTPASSNLHPIAVKQFLDHGDVDAVQDLVLVGTPIAQEMIDDFELNLEARS